ncbi:LysR family transcriptional regulator substrate-binding protein, partial [Staphylococcus aureus]
VMSAFFALYPGIELKLFDADSVRARQLLRDGEVDVGVLSRTEHLSNMQFVPLFEDEYFVVVPAEGHALSSRSFATPQDVAAYPLFITPRDSD